MAGSAQEFDVIGVPVPAQPVQELDSPSVPTAFMTPPSIFVMNVEAMR